MMFSHEFLIIIAVLTEQQNVPTLTDPVDVSIPRRQAVSGLISSVVVVALPTLLVCATGAHSVAAVIYLCACCNYTSNCKLI